MTRQTTRQLMWGVGLFLLLLFSIAWFESARLHYKTIDAQYIEAVHKSNQSSRALDESLVSFENRK